MIVFNITPIGAPRMTQKTKFASSSPRIARYYAFKDLLRLQVNIKKVKVTNSLKINFYLPIPKGKLKQIKENQPHDQKPDIDNMCKAFLDTLYTEDKHVWHLDASKYYSNKPRIEVEFY